MTDRYELAAILSALVGLGSSSYVLVRILDGLWEPDQLLFQVSSVLAVPFGGNLDIPVLVLVGILTGWMMLFCIDGTKRIQSPLVVIVAAASVGGFLRHTGRIIEAIARTPSAFVVGVVIGIATGLLSVEKYGYKEYETESKLEQLAWVQFPGAATAFRHTIAIVTILTVGDFATQATIVEFVGAILSGIVLLISLSIFMQYDYRRDVIALSPPDPKHDHRYHPYVFGGLYEVAHRDYHGFPIDNKVKINEAKSAGSIRNLPSFYGVTSFGVASGLRANPTNFLEQLGSRLLPRTAKIETREYTTEQLANLDDPSPDSTVVQLAKAVAGGVRRHLVTLVPEPIRDRFPKAGLTAMDRLQQADVVLLIGPCITKDESPPKGIDKFNNICRRFESDLNTELVVATTEADKLIESLDVDLELYGDPHEINNTIQIEARDNLDLERGNLSYSNVYPVTRFTEHGSQGFEKLLERLV